MIKDKLVADAKRLESELKKKGGIKMLQMFKGFNPDRLDLDEMVALLVFAEAMAAKYLDLGITAPAWMPVQLKAVKREIERRTADEKERKLTELKARRAAMATPDEKRQRLDAEIAALESA